MSKQLTAAEKMYFVDEISKLFHDLSEPFTPFTLLPQYVPIERPLSPENKRISLNALSRLRIIERKINALVESYLERVDDQVTQTLSQDLRNSFLLFYAAADIFINENQPQKTASRISDQIISLMSEIKDTIEKKLGVKSTHKADTVKTMKTATRRVITIIKK